MQFERGINKYSPLVTVDGVLSSLVSRIQHIHHRMRPNGYWLTHDRYCLWLNFFSWGGQQKKLHEKKRHHYCCTTTTQNNVKK